MSADRRRGFESWARTNGDVAVRAHDRRAIAEDIFDAAGADEVAARHVDEVSRRYRERLAGAQKILLAHQIGDEILRWQREPTRPTVSRAADSRREDDEIIGIELDSMTLSGADVAAAAAAMAQGHAARPAAPPPRGSGSHRAVEAPQSGSTSTSSTSLPRVASAGEWTASAPRSAPHPPRAGESAPPASSGAPERARSEGAQDWAAPPLRAQPPPPGDDEPGLWAPLRSGPPSAPPGELDLPPLFAAAASRSAPPSPSDSVRPAGGAISVAPPGGAFSGALPSTPPASTPPSRRPRAPDASTKTFEIDGDAIRATPTSVAPNSGAAPSTSSAAPPPGFVVPSSPARPAGLTRRQGIIAGAVFCVLAGIVIVLRTSAALGNKPVEVQGHTVSTHLGVSLEFAEPWTHERKKDDAGSHLGFARATSTYYQGVTAEDFLMQLTVVTLSPKEGAASGDDVRKLGATELATTVTDRTCTTFDRSGAPAFRCVAKTTYKARSFAMFEEYFLAGSRVVYARALLEALATDLAPVEPPKRGEVARPPGTRPPSPIAEVDQAKIEAILDSIEPLAN